MLAVMVLSGCLDDPPLTSGEPSGSGPWECDYELDDYAGDQERLMVHWDLEGYDPQVPSGIEMTVFLQLSTDATLSGTTTTDCILFDMTGLDADVIRVGSQEGECRWFGLAETSHSSGFHTEKVDVRYEC